jgi:hypothetical protein
MKRLFLAAAAAAAMLAAPAARAQSGIHTHDGFYLHLEGGLGGFGTSASAVGNDLEFSGTGGVFAIGLGGAVTPNLVLAGQLWGTSVSNPTYKQNGVKFDTTDTSVGLSAIGLEVTYYVMPVGLYLSAVPSIGTLSSKVNGASASTQRGFALKLAVGKEWWVSDNWGIGLNVQYAHGTNKDKDEPGLPTPSWTTNWFGVAFSATFN